MSNTKTPGALIIEREQAVAFYKKSADWHIAEFTCDECPQAPTCEFVFDGYNTNGDCLAEK